MLNDTPVLFEDYIALTKQDWIDDCIDRLQRHAGIECRGLDEENLERFCLWYMEQNPVVPRGSVFVDNLIYNQDIGTIDDFRYDGEDDNAVIDRLNETHSVYLDEVDGFIVLL